MALPHGAYLCEDILLNILLRVPAQSLHNHLRFVNKQWFRIITDPAFVQAHRAKANSRVWLITSQFIGAHNLKQNIYSLPLADESTNRITKDPLPMHSTATILASCNGLVLLQQPVGGGCVSLSNLVTKKELRLPPFTSRSPFRVGGGTVFNPRTEEYTVVVFYNFTMGEPFKCRILSLLKHRKLAWKHVHCPFSEFDWSMPPVSTAQGLTLYWYSYNRRYLVSMENNDLDGAKFGQVKIPEDIWSVKDSKHEDRKVMDMGGRVSIGIKHGFDHDIWVLVGDGESKNWTKLRTVTLSNIHAHVVGSLRGGKAVVFEIRGTSKYISYDVEDGTEFESKLSIDRWEKCIINYVMDHVDSLISIWDDHGGSVEEGKKKRKRKRERGLKFTSKSVHQGRETSDGRLRSATKKALLLELTNCSSRRGMCKRTRISKYSK